MGWVHQSWCISHHWGQIITIITSLGLPKPHQHNRLIACIIYWLYIYIGYINLQHQLCRFTYFNWNDYIQPHFRHWVREEIKMYVASHCMKLIHSPLFWTACGVVAKLSGGNNKKNSMLDCLVFLNASFLDFVVNWMWMLRLEPSMLRGKISVPLRYATFDSLYVVD